MTAAVAGTRPVIGGAGLRRMGSTCQERTELASPSRMRKCLRCGDPGTTSTERLAHPHLVPEPHLDNPGPRHVGQPRERLRVPHHGQVGARGCRIGALLAGAQRPTGVPRRAATRVPVGVTERRPERTRVLCGPVLGRPRVPSGSFGRGTSERSGSGLGVSMSEVRIFDAKGPSAVRPRSRCTWPRGGPTSPGGLRPMSWQLARRHHSGATQTVANRREVR